MPVLVICNAQDKAAVHAVAVAHIAFFGKGAQLLGEVESLRAEVSLSKYWRGIVPGM
ncbi:hypothetical protein LLE38_10135 [Neisseria gonorrhoeae]|nr:hypothetical protein [Neisseria gonorrhoeae]UYA79243.1 hypothetical protein LLE38_10135 [Neisseria gonorrhoeae]